MESPRASHEFSGAGFRHGAIHGVSSKSKIRALSSAALDVQALPPSLINPVGLGAARSMIAEEDRPTFLGSLRRTLAPPFIDQIGNQACPACLMTRSQASARIAVEEFMK